MSCKAFAELYKDRVPESLLIPAWEALTGKKYKRKAQARS
jgi:hypothetical protein